MSEMIDAVVSAINETILENGFDLVEISESTNILNDTPIDSLGLAVVVMKMEERTGKDPFKEGFINFHTVGELAKLYER